ncbi:hypothetical protein ACRALDRAFT_2023557 [Sodiomyces alcalophilus JCM 7366]|uniref:uncharacterized protein n=1 Tax=Sodiomyces alcalophilus JCM 7366 TaxID=591952 RepID=UPI0039B36772
MGRTSKFTFPIPDKRPKNNLPPIISPPMSKVQRILGNAEINIEPPRPWDTMSASGISVSVSEHSSAASSYHSEQERRFFPSGNDNANGASNWEVESETLPAHLHSSTTRHTSMGFPGEGKSMRDPVSNTSIVSRPRSNSTLKSWYDKSRVPLSISQQTSSSAIAKGVPSKASRLLDVDGTSFNAPRPPKPASTTSTSTKKKRPSRLDFTSFISGHRHHHRETHTDDRPAESSSFSSEITLANGLPSPVQRMSLRRLVRRPTRERLADLPEQDQNQNQSQIREKNRNRNPNPNNRPRTGATQMHGILNANAYGPNSPQDLYNHYEEAAFRQVAELPAEDVPATTEDDAHGTWPRPTLDATPAHTNQQTGSPWSTPLRSPSHSGRDHHRFPNTNAASNNSPHPNPVIREPHHDDRRDSKMSYPGTSTQSASAAGSILSRSRQYKGSGWDNDYASSVTSVSSRHTKTSRASKHTNQSLPDSDRQERSVLSLSSDSEGDGDEDQELDSLVETASKSARSFSSMGQSPRDFPGGDRKSRRPSVAPTNNTYLTIPSTSSNTSSNNSDSPSPPAKTTTPKPDPRSSSRMSTRSAATSTNTSTRATTNIMEEFENPSPSSSLNLHHDRPESVATSESNQGLSSSSRYSHPRFMAVTRQEQMLLAALRSKRAMMRENANTIPEAAVELESPLPEEMLYGHKHTSSQATIRGPAAAGDGNPHQHQSQPQFPPLRHQGSGTSTGTVKFGSQTTTKQRDSSRSSSRLSNRSAEMMAQQKTARRPSPGLGDFAFDHVDEEDAEGDESDGFLYSHRDRVVLATPPADGARQGEQRPGNDQDARRGSASSGRTNKTPITSAPPPGPPPTTLPDPPPRTAAPREKRAVSRESRPRKGHGVPRPDSPISAACWPVPPTSTPASRAASVAGRRVPADTARRKAVRLSAVGGPGGSGPELGWWGDDG